MPAITPTQTAGEALRYFRVIGLNTGPPTATLPGADGEVGTWITTSTVFSGTLMTTLHCGQGPCLPANLSLTSKRFLQPGQTRPLPAV